MRNSYVIMVHCCMKPNALSWRRTIQMQFSISSIIRVGTKIVSNLDIMIIFQRHCTIISLHSFKGMSGYPKLGYWKLILKTWTKNQNSWANIMPAKANLRNPKHRQVLQAQLKEVNQKYILNGMEAIFHYSITIHTCTCVGSEGVGDFS